MSDAPSHVASAESDAARAIALCRRGDVADGVALYRKVLKTPDVSFLPVGVHLKMLQSFGLNDTADIIRRSALGAGADINIAAVMAWPTAVIVEEYRELFARGFVNGRMVSKFLIALSKLGLRDELAAMLDSNRLFYNAPMPVGEAAAYWKSLERILLEEKVDNTWQESFQSVRKMHLVKLKRDSDGLVEAMLAEVHRQTARYVANWAKADHVLSRWVPRKFTIAYLEPMIAHGDGYNVPHIHPKSWITGVLYIAGPDHADAGDYSPGALRIGPPIDVVDSEGWPNITVAPTPGTLVIMPSYYTHWTVPLGRPGLRISIAFDVIESAS